MAEIGRTLLTRLLDGLAKHRQVRESSAEYAMNRAMALLNARDWERAASMLEYAHRCAPDDGAISVALALVQLELNNRSATEHLARLAGTTEWVDLWLTLIAAHLKFGDVERAVLDLEQVLSRLAVPQSELDVALIAHASRPSSAPGWCGLDTTGHVTIYTDSGALGRLVVRLDEHEIPCSSPRSRKSGSKLRLPGGWHTAARLEVVSDGQKSAW